jgi:ankyrin repeat protein
VLWKDCPPQRRVGIVKLLVETGKVDLNIKDEKDQRTALSWAAGNGFDEVVKLLLETRKIDINAKDRNDRTPLSWAAANGHDKVVKVILATREADVDGKDDHNFTPLLRALCGKVSSPYKRLT